MTPEQGARSFEILEELLNQTSLSTQNLKTKVESAAQDFGIGVYSQLFLVLAGLHLPPNEAKERWRRVLDHRLNLEQKTSATVDVRVALVSYLVEGQHRRGDSFFINLAIGAPPYDFDSRDETTNLAGSSSFTEHLENEIRKNRRNELPMTLLLLDPDDFGQYKERNGRDAGDRALARIDRLLARSLRAEDQRSRLGGKVFAVALQATPKMAAEQVAERLRGLMESQYFPGQSQQPQGKLTVSFGVAAFPVDASDASELIRQSERALSVAKATGKNRVHLCGEDRRSHRRVNSVLEGTFSTPTTGKRALKTLNLSTNGVQFTSSQDLPPDSLLDVRLKLPNKAVRIAIAMRVLESRMERQPSTAWIGGRENTILGSYAIRARTVDMSSEDMLALKEYLQREQTPASSDQ